jgi:hypothetical protein
VPLTKAQRRKVNTRNAQRSTGPKSEITKAISSRNSLKHGLCCTKIMTLPQEDPDALAARTRQWQDYYRPASPGAQHLMDRCVRSSLLADRCFAYHDDVTARQVREATLRWDCELEAELNEHVARLPTEPTAAVEGLRRTAAGCEYLAARFGHLLRRHVERGALCPSDRDEAIWLQGDSAESEALASSPTAYRTRLLNLLSYDHPNEKTLAWLLEPAQRPDTLEGVYRAGALPGREQAREQLRQILREQEARFREEGQWLAEHIDGPARAEAPGRAVLIQDPERARLYLRYSAEARTGFDRAWGSFQKALECDRAEGADPVPVAEPAAAPVGPSGAVSRNEANWAVGPQSSPEEIVVSDETSGTKIEPLGATTREVLSPLLPVAGEEADEPGARVEAEEAGAVSRNEANGAVEPQPSPAHIVVSEDTSGSKNGPLGETAREVPSPSPAGEDADNPGVMVEAEDAEAGCRNEPDLAVEPRLNVEEAGTSGDVTAPESAAGERTGRPGPPVTPGAAGREEAHPHAPMPGDPLGPHRSPVTGNCDGGSDLLRRVVERRWAQLATSESSHSISVGGDSWISPPPCGEGPVSKSYYFDSRDLRRLPARPNPAAPGGKGSSDWRSPGSSRKRRSRNARPEDCAGRGPGGT